MDRYTRIARDAIDDCLRSSVGVEAMCKLGDDGIRHIEALCNALRDRFAGELRAEARRIATDFEQRDAALAAVAERQRKRGKI